MIVNRTAAREHDGGFHVVRLNEITPEALAVEFPQWRTLARAGYAWVTMPSGSQEYHGPDSLILRTLSARTIRELARKLRFQVHLDGLTPDQFAVVWTELRRPNTRVERRRDNDDRRGSCPPP